MIERTFQHIPGVGPWRERDLWARGISTWGDFPPSGAVPALSACLDQLARPRIERAKEALAGGDLVTLAEMFPPREHWRLYPEFSDEAVFFDIEADGKTSAPEPTVVSLLDAGGLKTFIRGRNLGELPEALAGRAIWVTFNGGCYDIPVLKRHFGSFPSPVVHLDLRFLCRRVGLRGGLKEIEEQLGLSRPPHLKGVNGWDAILLWRAFVEQTEIEALRFLVEYNLYDAINLRSLLELFYNRSVEALSCAAPRLAVFERGEVLYELSKLIMALGPDSRDLDLLGRVRAMEAG
jgi:uncharacterized protein